MKKLFTLIFLLFFATNAYAVTQLKKTVKPSGGDYTSLEACMNANEQNLVTADKYFDVEIDGDWSGGADTSAVTIHNYTTDATRKITIYTKAGDARHNGIFNNKSTAYLLNTAGYSIVVGNNYVTIDGLQMIGGIGLQTYATVNNLIFKNNLVKGGAYFVVFGYNGYSSGPNYWFNNVFISTNTDNYSDPILVNTDSIEYFYSNTVIGNNAGNVLNLTGASIRVKNTIVLNPGGGRYCFAGSVHADSDYNLSGDASAPGTNSQKSQTPHFVNTSIDDYHLASDDTHAINNGLDTSSESAPLNFTTDYDGQTRNDWDIGADEYVSASYTGWVGVQWQ